MDPRDIAFAILGDEASQEEIDDLVRVKLPKRSLVQLPAAAAAASMVAMREAGCSTVLDFFSYLSGSAPAAGARRRSAPAAAARRRSASTATFKVIILANYQDCNMMNAQDIPTALGWYHSYMEYMRAKKSSAVPNLIHMLEEDASTGLQWGTNALFFFISLRQVLRIFKGGLLATIPPFTTLCLVSLVDHIWKHAHDLLCKVLVALPNLMHLFVIGMINPAHCLSRIDTQQTLQSSTSLRSIVIANMRGPSYINHAFDSPASRANLASHPSLTSFALFGFSQDSYFKVIQDIFQPSVFEDNPQLISLSFDSSSAITLKEDKLSQKILSTYGKVVLDALRRHGSLHQVSLDGTPLQLAGDAVIAAQLQKNEENANRIKLFKAQGFKQVRPSTVRLYLCGLPLSGKTSVSRSLAKWSKGRSLIRYTWSRLKGIKLSERTRGIEVTIIESPLERQRMSVWDMAGQMEYHSFHDSMLPDLGDLAIPSLFLFVWNPFETNAKGQLSRAQGGGLVLKRPKDFKVDFEYWLKFLASKTPKSNVLKPNVMVVITRADLGLPDMKVRLQTNFDSLRVEFEDYIHLDMEGFFQVDATHPKNVSRLGSHLLKCTNAILEGAINDFSICDEARNLFANWTQKGTIPPLITKERFFCLTQQNLGIHKEMCEAVAHSLNTSGDVIFFPTLELVVMDTKWFCHKIMGDILHFDMKFSRTCPHSNGFFERHDLESFLEKELINWRQGGKRKLSWTRNAQNLENSREVAGGDLVKLLIGLQLACPRDHTRKDSEIFLPASLCGKTRERLLPNKYWRRDEYYASYVGRRLTVRDSKRTFLTPGIFPRLQVTFHNMLTTRGINVDLQQDTMAFANGGSRVLVEFCALAGREHFIDILVCSRQTLDEALDWVHEKVIAEMTKLFADSRGVPGVDLVHSVIQPECITGLKEASQRQAVPIQVLRDILREHVEKKGAKLILGDGSTSIIYTWQTEPLVDDDVVRLLGEAEVFKIIEAYRSSLSEVANIVLDVSVEEKNSKQEMPKFGATVSQRQRKAIYDLVYEARMDIKEIKADIKRLSHQVEDLRGAVLPRLCELFTFVKEGEAGKFPRMFVVTEDDGGLMHRVVCRMVPGLQKLRLEFLCECRYEQAHLVNGQHGLSITRLEDGLLKRGLPYIQGFFKVAYAAAKIGAHVAVGCSDLIPDFTSVLASIVDAPEFGPSQPFANITDNGGSFSRIDLRSSQQWVFDVLSHSNCTRGEQIHAQFGLRRIRYADSAVAWVCDKHYSQGDPWPT